jgi:signal transduction histidine kinase
MQRLLVLTYTSLIAMLLLALGVPLAVSDTMNRYHHLAIARLNDTARFAVQAAAALESGQGLSTLAAALRQYDARTGVAVVLVDRGGAYILTSRDAQAMDADAGRQDLERARAGLRSDALEYPYNIDARPLVIAEPVESGGNVLGAVATISPTDELRAHAARRVALLVAVMLVAMVGAYLVGAALTRWIMRPVRLLDQAAVAVASGRYEVRGRQDIGPPEIRRLVRAFNTMADRLVSLLRAQRTFVADASHQLRNPLAALRLRAESLEPYVADDGRPAWEATVQEVKRLSAILDALLHLTGAQARQAPPQPVDVGKVAQERVEAWRSVADQHDIDVRLSGSAAVAACPADIVDQILDILLDNAVSVAPPGSTIQVWTAYADDRVEVHVADQGPGMTPEDKSRACDRFWRGPGSDEREGSGLGLAIACTLLDTVGGSLTFRDVHPGGLEVVVMVPAWRSGPGLGRPAVSPPSART